MTSKPLKPQAIRIADVVFVGPVMIGGGILLSRNGRIGFGGTLVGLGVLTMGYNAYNFERRRRQLASSKAS